MDIRITISNPNSEWHWSELLPYAPHLLWALFFVYLFWAVGPGAISAAISRVSKLGFAGVEVELSSEFQEVAEAKDVTLSASTRGQLTRRIEALGPILRSFRVLWIDDNPANNLPEISILRKLGILIDLAKSDEEAKRKVEGAVFDIVVSDMVRASDHEAGVALLPELVSSISRPLVIFYVGVPRDTPQGAFGLTTRPDELLNLIFDAAERRAS